ncbi:MAG TPA: cyclic nucleotide-binding domain-containing protein, partial [Geothrix sp.]|nr:cyclic nucleotide-binding domain-containing protein [Geothrix sp.]
MDAITSVLRRCEIFSGLSDPDLGLIAKAARRREVPADTRLFTQGDPRKGATVIAEGRVEITRDNGDGPEPVVILGPGDVAGEQSFLAPSPHSATATTLTPAVLLDLDRETVLQSLGQDGAAAIAVLSKVANVLHRRILYSATPRTGREQAYASGQTRRESDLIGPLDV